MAYDIGVFFATAVSLLSRTICWLLPYSAVLKIFQYLFVPFSGHHDPRRLSKSATGDKSDGTSVNNDEEAGQTKHSKQNPILRYVHNLF